MDQIDLSLDTRTDGDAVRVTVAGELDMATAPALRDHLAATLARAGDGGTLVLDLSGVDFMDSTGLQALVATRRRALATGARLRLVVRSAGPVVRVLGLTGLRDAFELDEV